MHAQSHAACVYVCCMYTGRIHSRTISLLVLHSSPCSAEHHAQCCDRRHRDRHNRSCASHPHRPVERAEWHTRRTGCYHTCMCHRQCVGCGGVWRCCTYVRDSTCIRTYHCHCHHECVVHTNLYVYVACVNIAASYVRKVCCYVIVSTTLSMHFLSTQWVAL